MPLQSESVGVSFIRHVSVTAPLPIGTGFARIPPVVTSIMNTVCKVRGCKKQWKRCQTCRLYCLCSSCIVHPGASSTNRKWIFRNVRGWGRSGESLSVAHAVGWGEESEKKWGIIFVDVLKGCTDFSATDTPLPVPTSVPEFDFFLERVVEGPTLRASGTIH